MAKDDSRNIRRAQLITTFGVGAIMPFGEDGSLIVGAIDWWDKTAESINIHDARLKTRLGVAELRMPPEFLTNGPDRNKKIRAMRFPTLAYCNRCHRISFIPIDSPVTPYLCPFCSEEFAKQNKPIHSLKLNERPYLIPERFVVICPEGHIDDFPVVRFTHKDDPSFSYVQYTQDASYQHQHIIKREVDSKTASLASIHYRCSCGAHANMSGITQKGALKRIMSHCSGNVPWLHRAHDDCRVPAEELLVVQRGGSNVWFSQVVTSIYIPNEVSSSEKVKFNEVFSRIEPALNIMSSSGGVDEGFVAMAATQNGLDSTRFLDYVKSRLGSGGISKDEVQNEPSYRYDEYQVLCENNGDDTSDLFVKKNGISLYNPVIRPFFESISIVERLKETKALIGFSRVTPRTDWTVDDFKKKLSVEGDANWVPAIQTMGEGIFFRFNQNALNTWIKTQPEALKRAERIANAYGSSFAGQNDADLEITPEMVMIHTFAHLMINQLSKSCGYSAASLKERVYVSSKPETAMAGVLIYTSAGDSQGSYGGLIKEGKPGHLENIVLAAINEARWCSYDPICIHSKGQGPDSCNLAACHNCALLPETSCEYRNRLLDRGVVVGVEGEAPQCGYFSSLE